MNNLLNIYHVFLYGYNTIFVNDWGCAASVYIDSRRTDNPLALSFYNGKPKLCFGAIFTPGFIILRCTVH